MKADDRWKPYILVIEPPLGKHADPSYHGVPEANKVVIRPFKKMGPIVDAQSFTFKTKWTVYFVTFGSPCAGNVFDIFSSGQKKLWIGKLPHRVLRMDNNRLVQYEPPCAFKALSYQLCINPSETYETYDDTAFNDMSFHQTPLKHSKHRNSQPALSDEATISLWEILRPPAKSVSESTDLPSVAGQSSSPLKSRITAQMRTDDNGHSSVNESAPWVDHSNPTHSIFPRELTLAERISGVHESSPRGDLLSRISGSEERVVTTIHSSYPSTPSTSVTTSTSSSHKVPNTPPASNIELTPVAQGKGDYNSNLFLQDLALELQTTSAISPAELSTIAPHPVSPPIDLSLDLTDTSSTLKTGIINPLQPLSSRIHVADARDHKAESDLPEQLGTSTPGSPNHPRRSTLLSQEVLEPSNAQSELSIFGSPSGLGSDRWDPVDPDLYDQTAMSTEDPWIAPHLGHRTVWFIPRPPTSPSHTGISTKPVPKRSDSVERQIGRLKTLQMEIQWANESLDPASSSSSTTDNFAPRPTAADLRRLQNELEAVSASLHSHLTPSSPAPITSSPPVMSTALASSPKIGREPPRQPRNFVPPVIRRQSYQQDSPQPVPSSPTVSPALRKEREKVGSLERTCEELQREVNATEERIQREKIAVEKLKSELTELEASTPRPRSLSKNEKLKSPRTAQVLGSSLSNSRDGFERSATQSPGHKTESQSPQPMDVDTGADSLSASIMGEISSLQAELAAYDSLLASEVTTQAKFVQKRDQLREQDRVRESLQTGKLPNIRTALTTLDTISVGVLAKLKASRLSQHRSLAVKRVGGTPAVAGLKRERD